jgi:hypothetical protein
VLDEKIHHLLQDGDVDREIMETLFRASRGAFEQFPESEAAQTALSALGAYSEHGYDTIAVSDDFSALSSPLQDSCTSALSRAIQKGDLSGAAAVFETLAEAISVPSQPPRAAADIVADYVVAVAVAWRSAGLRVGRASKFDDAAYTSKFHRFCDLVLTALVEPHSRRHLIGLEQLSNQARARQRQVPREHQKYVRVGLPLRDTQWLVTAHCLREGLRRFKKTSSRLHTT